MMATPKVILVESAPHRLAQLRHAFSQSKLPLQVVRRPTAGEGDVLVIGTDELSQLPSFRADGVTIPIIALVANEAARVAAHDAGVTEALALPGYVRDVVQACRLVAAPGERVGQLAGNLGELSSMFSLLRGIAALGRSGVLTFARGFRRGEVRFCDGEVTSAQVGAHHGQAALHQLLLWSDGKFDFRRESVVRRRQIPLPPAELFADAERFLAGVRDASGGVAPVAVLELNEDVAAENADRIPSEVHSVLRLFDGVRALGDIVEDSPYRVFETLRVVQRSIELKLLRPAAKVRQTLGWKPLLPIERWLVGDASVIEPAPPTKPAASSAGRGKKGRRKTPLPKPEAKPESQRGDHHDDRGVDWGVLAPRSVGVELSGLAGVVPAAEITGEIVAKSKRSKHVPATRVDEREGLEALTDAAARDRVFAQMGGGTPRSKVPSTPPPLEEAAAAIPVPELDSAAVTAKADAVANASAEAAPEAAKSDDLVTANPAAVPAVDAGKNVDVVAAPIESDQTTPFSLVESNSERGTNHADASTESSDGTVAPESSTSVDTAPLSSEPPTIASGEIVPRVSTKRASTQQPIVTAGEIVSRPIAVPTEAIAKASVDSPAILVADLAQAQAAVSGQIGNAQTLRAADVVVAPDPKTKPKVDPKAEVVEATRADAVSGAAAAFTEDEEQFFRAGAAAAATDPVPSKAEVFNDLDKDYKPVGFWQRLRGKRPTNQGDR